MAILERSRRSGVRLLLGALTLGGCGGEPEPAPAFAAPVGTRVVVEVLNGSGRRGLARIGTRMLREAGLDVVYFGTADTTLDSTRILIRRGSDDAVRRITRTLGVGRVERRPDSLVFVDVTVVLGRDWTPPPDPRP